MRNSKLYIRGIMVLAFLWGLIYILVIGIYAAVLYFSQSQVASIGAVFGAILPIIITLVIVFIQFLISPWLLDLSFSWIYALSWIRPEQLPPHLASFIAEQSQIHGISIKKVGMIHDQMPTALTYGRFKKNARLVLSDGILNFLSPEEQVAVVGHELGHIAHMDFFFMTLASAVPLILYNFYINSRSFGNRLLRSMKGSSSRNKGANPVLAAAAVVYAFAILSYLFYFISNLLVYFLSRLREYYADNFSGTVTKNPKALSYALVKIAYGMIQSQSSYYGAMSSESSDSRARATAYKRMGFTKASRALNIFDIKAAGNLVMTAYAQSQKLDPEAVARAAAFDLENPWATFLELQSTHPLTAKRLMAMDDLAVELGQEPAFPNLGQDLVHESLWDEFLLDLFLYYGVRWLVIIIPLITLVGFTYGYQIGMYSLATGLLISSLLWWWRVSIQYPKLDHEMTPIYIMEAVTDVSDNGYIEASPFRGKPIKLRGTVIGRATPGYYLSEDLVLQDPSGIITLDYNPFFGFMRWFTALFRVDRLVGNQVEVIGWYRRGFRPYVEIRKVILQDGRTWKSHKFFYYRLLAVLLFIAALAVAILAV